MTPPAAASPSPATGSSTGWLTSPALAPVEAGSSNIWASTVVGARFWNFAKDGVLFSTNVLLSVDFPTETFDELWTMSKKVDRTAVRAISVVDESEVAQRANAPTNARARDVRLRPQCVIRDCLAGFVGDRSEDRDKTVLGIDVYPCTLDGHRGRDRALEARRLNSSRSLVGTSTAGFNCR